VAIRIDQAEFNMHRSDVFGRIEGRGEAININGEDVRPVLRDPEWMKSSIGQDGEILHPDG
jgi:hypothetical protein